MLQGKTRKDGITLIALIVTIVILLILSIVTIMEVRETALFEKSRTAARDYKEAQEKEQEQMETLVDKVDDWKNDLPKARTEVKNTLKVGDYVIYNVQYTDACKKDTNFTENNGWRVIEPGREFSDGTYDDVKIIPTGIPVRLYYFYPKILSAQGENYAWKGSKEEVVAFKKKCGYVSTVETDAGVIAVAGLSNPRKFSNISVVKGENGGANKDNGKAWRELIKHNNEEVVGETSLANLMIEKDAGELIECPDLEIVKRKMSEKPGGKEFITTRSTDEDVIWPNEKFTTEDDAALGFWNLQDLGIGEYQKGQNNQGWWEYWIASPYSPGGSCFRSMTYSDVNGCFHGGGDSTYGLRPIVSLKSNIKLQKSEFQGN